VSGEFERIAEIGRRLAFGSAEIALGIGDDAALLTPSAHQQALSVDAQVEGVHFHRDLLSAPDIGYRGLAAALSDLAAMGARPRAALVSLVLPAAFADAELYALVDGIAEAQREYSCPVVGGNLASGGELSITTTVLGDAPDQPLTRAGARPGDALFVTGELGGAALGLLLLQSGKAELGEKSVLRWRRPVARIAEGAALIAVASAAIDVSDGLMQDLQHLCSASHIGVEVELDRLPLAPELARVAPQLGADPVLLALTGGEDYELAFTAPGAALFDIGTRIGTVVPGSGVRLLNAAGHSVSPPKVAGYDHFGLSSRNGKTR
jgi:thiamine-monophosphate kinase